MNTKYLAIDCFGWAEDSDLIEAIRKRREDSGKNTAINVYSFDADRYPTWTIRWFQPIMDCTLVLAYMPQDGESYGDLKNYQYFFPNEKIKAPE